MKTYYKVVYQEEGGDMVSCGSLSHNMVTYVVDEVATRPRPLGPLAIFDSYTAALIFKRMGVSPNRMKIFHCDVVLSQDTALWHSRSIDFTPIRVERHQLPFGTCFADSVILRKEAKGTLNEKIAKEAVLHLLGLGQYIVLRELFIKGFNYKDKRENEIFERIYASFTKEQKARMQWRWDPDL